LNGYVNTAMATPEFSQRLDAVGAVPKPGTAAQFAELYASEVTRWAEVVRSANIQAE
jgi:tripartite-type tricarboxylate transporter receptor subunit TctC